MTADAGPDSTAVRVALWRALHAEVDAPPPVLDDRLGLELVAPEEDWRARPDMDPDFTRGFRAAVAARSRFIEDLVVEEIGNGVRQYVLLGAGLDTFAQRRPDLGGRLRVFEIDQPGTQAWKRQRLTDVGYGTPGWLSFVPLDFEADDDWYAALIAAGFDADAPAVLGHRERRSSASTRRRRSSPSPTTPASRPWSTSPGGRSATATSPAERTACDHRAARTS